MSVPTAGSAWGKNNWPNTSAAAVPYMKKSYHSSAVPTSAPMTTRRSSDAVTDLVSGPSSEAEESDRSPELVCPVIAPVSFLARDQLAH